MMFNEWPYDVCLAYICRQTLTPSSTCMRTGRVRIVWVQSSHVRGRAGEVDKFKRPWVCFIDRSEQMATAQIGGLQTQKHRSELETEPTFLWLSSGMKRRSTMCLSPSHRLVQWLQADQVEERLQALEDRKHVPSFTIILYISSFVNAVVPRANL